MSELLSNLLTAGLIEKLDGNDERFVKMETAASVLSQEFIERPAALIRAILVGLDPNVPADDPTILHAEKALVNEWKSMSSIHTSTPVGLLRVILLDACHQASEGMNAAILWLTAADTLPLMRLGKEESAVRKILQEIAERTETVAIEIPQIPKQRKTTLKNPVEVELPAARKVNQEKLQARIAAASGPHTRGGVAIPNTPNPHWPVNNGNWSWEFTDRMSALLASELDALVVDLGKVQAEIGKKQTKALSEALNSQRLWLQSEAQTNEAKQKAEQTRLNALWWSEALYSSSLRCGYRKLEPELAAVVMAIDLVEVVAKPTPASVGFLLEETVNRLPKLGFEQEYKLHEFLSALREARVNVTEEWLDEFVSPPEAGRLSIRDLIVLTLSSSEWDIDNVLERAGLNKEIKMNIPVLSHTLFRQEQAVRLAENGK